MPYGYPSSSLVKSATAASTSSNSSVVMIIALICAIIGSVLVFVLFLRKENEKKYTGFVKWLYDFLQFNTLTLDAILRFTYLFLAIFITIGSFATIGTNFLAFLVELIIGNILLRVVYEISIILIQIHKNVRELNEKTKK